MSEIGSPKERDFAASLERAGTAALEFAESYMKRMMTMVDRELGSTRADPQEELMQYARMRHDPALLRQAYLEPLRQRMGKGRGNEAFVKFVQAMEKRLAPKDGTS